MTDIDTVAEAMKTVLLKNFDPNEFDRYLLVAEGTGIDLRELAQAAIDALQLTENYQTLADGSGGVSINWNTGETTTWGQPCTRMRRWVSPWVRVEPDSEASVASTATNNPMVGSVPLNRLDVSAETKRGNT